ncbi:hypothetical protein ACQR16_23645, partial [Bradyrhizobium oligotrophicum]|uniref:hypothetical protein n=1 Tax=Bradyrhizobium oligotrophicum TaxID=44255 RepID=UPI003EBEF1ED
DSESHRSSPGKPEIFEKDSHPLRVRLWSQHKATEAEIEVEAPLIKGAQSASIVPTMRHSRGRH